jgi:predicted outer membrane protein
VTTARRPHTARAITALTAAVGVAVLAPAPALAAPGPMGPADHDFLAKAHAAVAFAAAASELTATNGAAKTVKTVGKQIAAQDKQLDTALRGVAAKLQIELAPAPAPGLAELETVAGEPFDVAYVAKVRDADGHLLELAASLRIHTRNALLRDLAQRTATVMMGQLPLLESTGLIDFGQLPPATVAAAVTAPKAGPNADPNMLAEARTGEGFLWPSFPVAVGVLGVGLLGTLLGARRLNRSRFRGSRRA